MQPIIKGGYGFGYITVSDDDAPVMKTVYGNPPKKPDTADNNSGGKPEQESAAAEEKAPEPVRQVSRSDELEAIRREREAAQREAVQRKKEAEAERAALIEEYEQIRLKYERDAEAYIIHAKEKAGEIYEKTKDLANKTVNDARAEAENIRTQAAEDGRKQGYDDGFAKGHEEGYVSALKKCKDTLVELKELNAGVTERKEQLFLDYEHALFDSIFEIAQKITVESLKQKDKAVITKMLRAAAKRYRSSKTVKITLSQLDVSDEAEIDEAFIKELFSEGTLVEFEIVKDAPEGTLIIDNGSEITDAGVQTQLKMIEQLGKKKYRDKSFTELLQETMDKPKKKGKSKGEPTEKAVEEAVEEPAEAVEEAAEEVVEEPAEAAEEAAEEVVEEPAEAVEEAAEETVEEPAGVAEEAAEEVVEEPAEAVEEAAEEVVEEPAEAAEEAAEALEETDTDTGE